MKSLTITECEIISGGITSNIVAGTAAMAMGSATYLFASGFSKNFLETGGALIGAAYGAATGASEIGTAFLMATGIAVGKVGAPIAAVTVGPLLTAYKTFNLIKQL